MTAESPRAVPAAARARFATRRTRPSSSRPKGRAVVGDGRAARPVPAQLRRSAALGRSSGQAAGPTRSTSRKTRRRVPGRTRVDLAAQQDAGAVSTQNRADDVGWPVTSRHHRQPAGHPVPSARESVVAHQRADRACAEQRPRILAAGETATPVRRRVPPGAWCPGQGLDLEDGDRRRPGSQAEMYCIPVAHRSPGARRATRSSTRAGDVGPGPAKLRAARRPELDFMGRPTKDEQSRCPTRRQGRTSPHGRSAADRREGDPRRSPRREHRWPAVRPNAGTAPLGGSGRATEVTVTPGATGGASQAPPSATDERQNAVPQRRQFPARDRPWRRPVAPAGATSSLGGRPPTAGAPGVGHGWPGDGSPAGRHRFSPGERQLGGGGPCDGASTGAAPRSDRGTASERSASTARPRAMGLARRRADGSRRGPAEPSAVRTWASHGPVLGPRSP